MLDHEEMQKDNRNRTTAPVFRSDKPCGLNVQNEMKGEGTQKCPSTYCDRGRPPASWTAGYMREVAEQWWFGLGTYLWPTRRFRPFRAQCSRGFGL